VLINGQAAEEVAGDDRGLHYGDGLFETVAVTQGRPCLWLEHMRRMASGCRRLGLPIPDSAQLWEETRREIPQGGTGVLKILITRGRGRRGYAPPPDPLPTRIVQFSSRLEIREPAGDGVAVRYCATRLGRNPALAGIKHLNRLEQVLARAEWTDPAIAEGLMLDSEGLVVEGTMSNLFLVRDGDLATPRLDRCGVAGIMRARVMLLARGLGIPVAEIDLTPQDVTRSPGAFLCNSLIGLWPVRAVAGVARDVRAIPERLRQAVSQERFAP